MKDEGPRTADEGRGTVDEGPGTADEGPGTADEGPRTKDEAGRLRPGRRLESLLGTSTAKPESPSFVHRPSSAAGQPSSTECRSSSVFRPSSAAGRPSSTECPSSCPDLDTVIADLQRRHGELVDFIDAHKDQMRAGQFITAIDYQGRLANRIGRLLRDRQQLAGDQDGALEEAISEALAIVGDAWGVALAPPIPQPRPPQGGEGE